MDQLSVLEALEAAAKRYDRASDSEQSVFHGVIVKFLADMYGQFEDDIESQIEW